MSGFEMRCPVFPVRMFGVVYGDLFQSVNGDEALIQVACRDCKRLWQKTDRTVFRVLHYYDTWGRLTKTEVLRNDSSVTAAIPVNTASLERG